MGITDIIIQRIFPCLYHYSYDNASKPIYLSTFTGRPPDEPSILGGASVYYPFIQQQFPEIIDFWLPPEGCSYRIAVVSIKKAYAYLCHVMMGVWSF